MTLLVVKASHTITFPSCIEKSKYQEGGKQTKINSKMILIMNFTKGGFESMKFGTCEELTILLLSLHQSMHRTLFPCPFRVLRVFMTN